MVVGWSATQATESTKSATVSGRLQQSFFMILVATRQTAGRRVLGSLGLYVRHANNYALTEHPCCPSNRIERHRDVLRIKQPIQL